MYSGIKLNDWTNSSEFIDMTSKKKQPVKIKIVQTKKKQKKPDDNFKKILETQQEKTEKPEDAKFAGHVDHQAKKETKISDKAHRVKAANPGVKGNPNAKGKTKSKTPQNTAQKQPPKDRRLKKPVRGKVGFETFQPKPRNPYEAMLPSSVTDLAGQIDAGFQDYIDDKIEEGDRIDISTSEYRYIGYFTNMRKAIELVWIYPSAASRRGMQGKVGIEFTIHKDGSKSQVRVINSSGYKILDDAIVEAIRTATFAPLPTSFNKDKMLVTGNFTYVLSSYGSH
jgi:protein TonB